MYPEEFVLPMRQELSSRGFQDLYTPQEVVDALSAKGTTLLMVNSVCGCAAGAARPAVIMSLQNEKNPDHLTAVFAGVDFEAVQQARQLLLPFPPSSPCIALFKDGELVHMIERHHIEGRPAEMIAENLQDAYNEFC